MRLSLALAKNRHWNKRGGGGGTGSTVPAKLQSWALSAAKAMLSLVWPRQWTGYKNLGKDFPHTTVDHAKGGAIHTQTIEGFWSIFKRSVVSHKICRSTLPSSNSDIITERTRMFSERRSRDDALHLLRCYFA
jgi:hypothetical protein